MNSNNSPSELNGERLGETFCLFFTYTEPGVLVPLQLKTSEKKCYFSCAQWKWGEPSARQNSWPVRGPAAPKESRKGARS